MLAPYQGVLIEDWLSAAASACAGDAAYQIPRTACIQLGAGTHIGLMIMAQAELAWLSHLPALCCALSIHAANACIDTWPSTQQ